MPHLQRCRVIVRTHVLWAFVATQEMTHAMPRTVTEGDTCFPHILLGECIELVASCATRETGTCQGYMPLEHIGIIEFSLLRDTSSEPNGAGDIGCAVQVLTARVKQ